MMELSLIIAAAAPGMALLMYFYLKDRYETEPLRVVMKLFVIGVLLVFPTMVIQRGFILGLGDNEWMFSFIISGGLEEFLKWFVIYHLIYRHLEFDEPYDGIVYSVALSIGFATLENIIYALYYRPAFAGLLMRALLPVSGHALFGVIMGYYLGKAKFSKGRERKYVIYALLLPILWHGWFDYLLLRISAYWMWVMVPFMAFLWIKGLSKVSRANAGSPLRVVVSEQGD
jgi:RsiW-degrading membrane proteinase PrsW (M82 family)